MNFADSRILTHKTGLLSKSQWFVGAKLQLSIIILKMAFSVGAPLLIGTLLPGIYLLNIEVFYKITYFCRDIPFNRGSYVQPCRNCCMLKKCWVRKCIYIICRYLYTISIGNPPHICWILQISSPPSLTSLKYLYVHTGIYASKGTVMEPQIYMYHLVKSL